MRTLPQPYSQWMASSRLLDPSDNGICLVVVDDDILPAARSLYLARLLFGKAREIYPDLVGLIPVTGLIYEHVLAGDMTLSQVRQPREGSRDRNSG